MSADLVRMSLGLDDDTSANNTLSKPRKKPRKSKMKNAPNPGKDPAPSMATSSKALRGFRKKAAKAKDHTQNNLATIKQLQKGAAASAADFIPLKNNDRKQEAEEKVVFTEEDFRRFEEEYMKSKS